MFNKCLFIWLFLLLFLNAASQKLYIPRELKKAYSAGTRSMDGRPGKNYFQNSARYDITLDVMPPSRIIKGKETVVYRNNSKDTLKTIRLKWALNIHKPGAARNFPIGPDYLNEGISVQKFTWNNKLITLPRSAYTTTNGGVALPEPLSPGDSVQLYFEWQYPVSKQSNREGMIDSTTYFLAYSYPRIAVYDDIDGWDRITFTDQQEFYNDFCDYQLTINAPAGYLVWATGTLLNPDEVLHPDAAIRYKASLTTNEIIKVVSLEDIRSGKATLSNGINSWKFKADNIPDVAAGVSNHFVWDASSVVVDTQTGRRASAQAAYNDTAKDYHQMVDFTKQGLAWLSSKWPGIPYPYNKMTVFQGYADMEYPMMVNDNSFEDPNFARFVAEHEIAHTWFPFYMGINESRYAFMDEGWTTAFEYLINSEQMGKEKAMALFKEFRTDGWSQNQSSLEDIPIITPADVLKNFSYGDNAYVKPALGYIALKELLGDELFRKALHAFMDRWKGKHPLPWDMFFSFNNVTGRDLNWFWNNWFFSNYYSDLRISTLKEKDVIIQNEGGLMIPFDLIITYEDNTRTVLHQNPAVWKNNFPLLKITLKNSGKKIKTLTVDTGIFADAVPSDNFWSNPL